MKLDEYKKLARKKKRGTPEDDGQEAIIKELRRILKLFPDKFAFYHVPNQLARIPMLRIVFWKLGLTPGVNDLFILGPNRVILPIELKHGKTSQSEPQKEWERLLKLFGFEYHLIRFDTPKEAVDRVLFLMAQAGLIDDIWVSIK